MTAIGLMGGTFDPIHFGHLRAAEEVLQGFGLEKVIFIPAGEPPHKSSDNVSSKLHRYKMTELAVRSNPNFEVSTVEIEREGLSYTVDTLSRLRQEHGDSTAFYYIVGLDAIAKIMTWKDPSRLFKLSNFVAVSRPGYSLSFLTDLRETLGDTFLSKIHVFSTTLLAIASTEIRRMVRCGESIRYLVPVQVMDYIEKERLYLPVP